MSDCHNPDHETIDELLELIRELHDSTPCRFDHHGYCQEHVHLSESPCPHGRAQAIFADRAAF